MKDIIKQNKGQTYEYDLLGHPSKVNGKTYSIEYVYAPDGRKMRTVHKTYTSTNKKTVKTSTTTDYTNGYIFTNGKPTMYCFDGGYYSFDNQGKLNGCHYYIQDYQGNNREVVNASTNAIEQINHYYSYGGLMGVISTKPNTQNFKYGGKELDLSNGLNLYDFEARQYDAVGGPNFTSVDPLAEKYYSISPYAYCAGDPINLIDPTGCDWCYTTDSIEINGHKYEANYIYWTDSESQEEMVEKSESGTYIGSRLLLVIGSYDEKLGTDGKLDGPEAKCATAIAFGDKGPDDVQSYRAFTMSSDFFRYGAIANGDYDVTYQKYTGKSKIPKNYAVESGNPINCLNGRNMSKYFGEADAYSWTQKNGIFVHRTNWSGKATGRVSTGCILIDGRQWNEFETQMGHNSFKMILRRGPFF